MLKAILLNDTSYDDHHGCQIVMQQIHRLTSAAGIRIVWSSPLRNDWSSDLGLLAAAHKADLCLINGEGTLHDDAPAALQLMQAAEHFSARGIPCFLINALWQNNPLLARYLPSLAGCYLRDARSASEVQGYGVGASVVPDLTLTMLVAATGRPRAGLLINGSVLADRQQQAVVSASAVPDARYLSVRTFTPLRFAAHHRAYFLPAMRQRWKQWRHRLSSGGSDAGGVLNGKAMGRYRWRHACIGQAELLESLESAEGVVTGRFHMVTLCLLTRTPFFAVPSNSHKIEGLLEQLGMADRIFGDYEDALKSRTRLRFSVEELQRIDTFIDDAVLAAEKMFSEIVETVNRIASAASPDHPG